MAPAAAFCQTPAQSDYQVAEALAIPSTREVAVDLLWALWRGQPESLRGKTGLALSGGGARGMAHVGALRHLLEIGYPIEAVAGSSIGGLVGGLYAAGVDIDGIESMGREMGKKDFTDESAAHMIRLALSDGLASSEPMERWLRTRFGKKTFDDTRVPFVTCAVDLASGELIFLKEGDLASSIRAAITIPGLFEPASIRQYFLVDGGLLFNIPTAAAYKLGAENVLLLDVSSRNQGKPLTRPPSSIRALYRSIQIQGDLREEENYVSGDYTLRILTQDFEIFEFDRYDQLWEMGAHEARAHSLDLKLAFVEKAMLKRGRQFFVAGHARGGEGGHDRP
ncbi:MAG: patatin-like phospholipase family protein [Elusimicrobiota bacterium]